MLLNITSQRKKTEQQGTYFSDILLPLIHSNPLNVTIMIVGIPKEIKNNENRVSLTPSGARELVQRGHTVYVQHTAGINSGFTDEDYEKAGAHILPSIEDVYGTAEMIIKVKEPIESEYGLVREGQLVFTYFHFACDQQLTEAMIKSKSVCMAYETVVDRQGAFLY